MTPTLDPASFTITTVPERLARARKSDPWPGYATLDQRLPVLREPVLSQRAATVRPAATPPARSSIVVARKPRK